MNIRRKTVKELKLLLKEKNLPVSGLKRDLISRLLGKTIKVNPFDFRYHRDKLVTVKDNPYFEDKEWLKETPKVVRSESVKTCIANIKTSLTNLKNGHIKHFELRFRQKRKERSWTIGIEKSIKKENDKHLSIFTRSFKELKQLRYYKRCNVPFENKPNHDCFIHKDKFNDYYLLCPFEKKKQEDFQGSTVSIDPGVKRFLCTYDTDGDSYFLGVNFKEKIMSYTLFPR